MSQKETLVTIATSEKTWKRLVQYCFNQFFLANRSRFDLAISFNGDASRARAVLDSVYPEYVFERPNRGYDIGALNHSITHAPRYEGYIFLHDDHWFQDFQWFDKLACLHKLQGRDTVFGNLVYAPNYFKSNLQGIIPDFNGWEKVEEPMRFINGLGGFFPRSAVECFLNMGGLPYADTDDKKLATIAEALSGLLLGLHGFHIEQIPPQYNALLIHAQPTPSYDLARMDSLFVEPIIGAFRDYWENKISSEYKREFLFKTPCFSTAD